MTSEIGLLAAVCLFFAYALIGKRLSASIVTAPMLFLLAGYGFHELGVLDLSGSETVLHLLAEISLVVLLFADASMIDPRRLLKGAAKPARMLVIGLPLVIFFGTVVGWLLLPGWPFWEVGLLAAILAPTDAALGQAVVTNPNVPEDMRRTLAAESGLNDGLALPFVLFFACLAVGGVHDEVQVGWAVFVGQQVGFGALAGVLVGLLGGWLLLRALDFGLASDETGGVAVLALAGLSYLAADLMGGNGFLAAFVGGLAFGQAMKGRHRFVFEFIETEGQILIVLSFFAAGILLLPEGLHHASLGLILLIVLSLFLIRPVAVWISLIGTGAPVSEKVFYGWFGPRGLATALFALLVLESFDGLIRHDELLAAAAVAVLLSAVLHGVTAAPSAAWFGRNARP